MRECIEPLGLSITDAAAALCVTRTTLSELVNGKRGISPDRAAGASRKRSAHGRETLQSYAGNAESWLVQQAPYDLANVRIGRIKMKRLQPA